MSPSWTPSELARRYRVSPDKVLAWIKAGELKAVNVATRRSGRPRYAIPPEAVAEFEAGRAVVTRAEAPRKRLTKSPGIIEYF